MPPVSVSSSWRLMARDKPLVAQSKGVASAPRSAAWPQERLSICPRLWVLPWHGCSESQKRNSKDIMKKFNKSRVKVCLRSMEQVYTTKTTHSNHISVLKCPWRDVLLGACCRRHRFPTDVWWSISAAKLQLSMCATLSWEKIQILSPLLQKSIKRLWKVQYLGVLTWIISSMNPCSAYLAKPMAVEFHCPLWKKVLY